MSGFLERLAQRAQGGSGLASLPTIRPMPRIYGAAAPGNEPVVETESLVPGVTDVPSRREDAVPPRQGQAPAQASAVASGRAPKIAPAAPDRMEPRNAAMAAGQRSASRLPIGTEVESPPRAERMPQGAASPELPRAVPQPDQPSAMQTRPDASRGDPRAAPSPAVEAVEPARAKPPAPPRSGLECLFEAIEAAEDTGVIAGPAAARRVAAPAMPDREGGPLVSIGRITISVAPPPAAPPGPARSHGFDAYARLRGGYER